MAEPKEVWITGIGIVSSLGEGLDAIGMRSMKSASMSTRSVLRLTSCIRWRRSPSTHRSPKGDQRQMEAWQRIGTYAAGLALDSAGVKGVGKLGRMDMVVAPAAANVISRSTPRSSTPTSRKFGPGFLNERLMNDLRPTPFSSQSARRQYRHRPWRLRNVAHLQGEEASSIDAALACTRSGQSDIALIGAPPRMASGRICWCLRIRRFQPDRQIRAGVGALGTRICAGPPAFSSRWNCVSTRGAAPSLTRN
jgi:3-oxoacyl-[acyl-carrier-protein] synthase II